MWIQATLTPLPNFAPSRRVKLALLLPTRRSANAAHISIWHLRFLKIWIQNGFQVRNFLQATNNSVYHYLKRKLKSVVLDTFESNWKLFVSFYVSKHFKKNLIFFRNNIIWNDHLMEKVIFMIFTVRIILKQCFYCV